MLCIVVPMVVEWRIRLPHVLIVVRPVRACWLVWCQSYRCRGSHRGTVQSQGISRLDCGMVSCSGLLPVAVTAADLVKVGVQSHRAWTAARLVQASCLVK